MYTFRISGVDQLRAVGDVSIRLNACEYLHASIVYMTGTNSRRTQEMRRQHSLKPLFTRVFPALLNLAVDSNAAIHQLFRDLLFQVTFFLIDQGKL